MSSQRHQSRSRASPETTLRGEIAECRACPRLVAFREGVKPRASYSDERYWRKPVAGFGDINGRVLILGLAPAAHGGNRTGRVFTGDSSGRFLVKALHKSGFANQPVSESMEDGLVYIDCYLTAAVKCVPPGDRPSKIEFENCAGFLDREIEFMQHLEAVVALGSLAFRAYLDHLERIGIGSKGIKFAHGKSYAMDGLPTLYAAYHPSPRNTNTGRLNESMLVAVFSEVRSNLAKTPRKHN